MDGCATELSLCHAYCTRVLGPTLSSSLCLQLTENTTIGATGDRATSVVVEGSQSAIGHVRNHSLTGSIVKDSMKRVKNVAQIRVLVRLFLSYPVDIIFAVFPVRLSLACVIHVLVDRFR